MEPGSHASKTLLTHKESRNNHEISNHESVTRVARTVPVAVDLLYIMLSLGERGGAGWTLNDDAQMYGFKVSKVLQLSPQTDNPLVLH